MRVTKEQSQYSIGRLKALESQSGVLVNLPIKLKVNWDDIVERLKNKGFLNKKGQPASVARLTTLRLSDLIKYFLSALHGYLSYYRCADDFNQVKNRFYWYFKYSLVSTIKAKQKLGGRAKVFFKYGPNISCLDSKGREISFLKSEDLKRIKKSFLINIAFEDPNKIFSTTWIRTQNTTFIFDVCAVKGCGNTHDIQVHHVRHLQRDSLDGSMILQGRRKKLQGWKAMFSTQKAKQLPLCSKHHKMLYDEKLNKDQIDKTYMINNN